MVSNQLAKMEKDFKSGSPFPGLPMIMDHKAFHVKPSQTLSISSSANFLYWRWHTSSQIVVIMEQVQSGRASPDVPLIHSAEESLICKALSHVQA